MSEKKLYSVSDAENLDISEVHNLYKQYISKSQVELIGSFGFGNDLVDYAEGSYIYLNNGKKIIDFTGGIGVLGQAIIIQELFTKKAFSRKKRMKFIKTFFSLHGHNSTCRINAR